jgi:hypothetical protein
MQVPEDQVDGVRSMDFGGCLPPGVPLAGGFLLCIKMIHHKDSDSLGNEPIARLGL